MKLLEIVRGRDTSKEVIATSLKLAKRLGKVGVVVGNCFGFVANRMLAYYMREAYLLLEEGASVPQIDRALTDFGLPVGPFGMQDIAGIDVGARIRQYLKSTGKTRAEGPQSADSRSSVRDGPLRSEDRRRLVHVRSRQPHAHPRPADRPDGRGGGRSSEASRGDRSRTRRSSRESRRRSPTKARGCSRKATRRARATSTSSTATASGSRGPAAARCSMPTRSASPPSWRASRNTAPGFGDYWEPAPLLEKLVAEGRGSTAAERGDICPAHDRHLDIHALRSRVGEEIAVSDWFEITQARIDQFAEATGDRQWIHVDPVRAAAESPFKTTIAHGFLTLSLVSALMGEAIQFGGLRMAINYGVNRVRFVSPVPSGARVRGRFVPLTIEDVAGGLQVTWQVTVEREHGDKPSCIAEWIVRYYPD